MMRFLKWVSCFLVVTYFVVYIVLTSFGAYEDNITTLAKIGKGCLCVSDLEFWQPRYILHTRYNGRRYSNTLGSIYLPLIFLDHKYWHKEKVFNLD
jgi:hypothetical protein